MTPSDHAVVLPQVIHEHEATEIEYAPTKVVQVWQLIDRKNTSAPPMYVYYPNAALAERFVRGLLRADNCNNQYATAPDDFYLVHVCNFVQELFLYLITDDRQTIEFRSFV